jgi:hypothetical protein
MIRDCIGGWLRDLYMAGYGWTFTGHLKETVVDDGENVRVVRAPAMTESLIGDIARLCQIQGTLVRQVTTPMEEVTIERPGKTPIVRKVAGKPKDTFYFSMRPGQGLMDGERMDAKNPYLGHLRDIIELPQGGGWPAFESNYHAAMTAIKEKFDGQKG